MGLQKIIQLIPMGLVLALGLHLSLAVMGLQQSLWLDEAATAKVAANGLGYYLNDYAPKDFHPPLHYLLEIGWTSLVGLSDIALRIPSILSTLVTIILVYLITFEYKRRVADMAAVMMATSPLAIYYSTEARMYAMAMMLVTLGIYAWIRWVKSDSKIWFVVLSVSLMGAFLTHYLTVLIIPVLLIPRSKLRQTMTAVGIGLAGLIFWLPILRSQLGRGLGVTEAWGELLGYAGLKNLALIPTKFIIGRVSIEPPFIYGMLVLMIGFAYFYIGMRNRKILSKHGLVVSWLVAPIVIGFVMSFWVPVLTYFRFLFVLPAMYILLALGIDAFKRQRLRVIASLIVLTVNVFAAQTYLTEPKFQREQWQEAVLMVEEIEAESMVVVFTGRAVPDPWTWYAGSTVQAVGAGSVDQIEENLSGTIRNQAVVVFEYLSDLYDPDRAVLDWYLSQGFSEIGSRSFYGLGQVRVMSRQEQLAVIEL